MIEVSPRGKGFGESVGRDHAPDRLDTGPSRGAAVRGGGSTDRRASRVRSSGDGNAGSCGRAGSSGTPMGRPAAEEGRNVPCKECSRSIGTGRLAESLHHFSRPRPLCQKGMPDLFEQLVRALRRKQECCVRSANGANSSITAGNSCRFARLRSSQGSKTEEKRTGKGAK
jgi:hypothetical protein